MEPKMEAKVKITVIATGFPRNEKAGRLQRATTPVDMQNYQSVVREGTTGGSSFYRPGSEQSKVDSALNVDLDFGPVEEDEGEDLDVPTFLRKAK